MKKPAGAFITVGVARLLQLALGKPVGLGFIIWPGEGHQSENPAPIVRWDSGKMTGSGRITDAIVMHHPLP